MAQIIKLRQARKAKTRQESNRIAEANRLKHGRTKAEKRLTEASRRRLELTLDGARREKDKDDIPGSISPFFE